MENIRRTQISVRTLLETGLSLQLGTAGRFGGGKGTARH